MRFVPLTETRLTALSERAEVEMETSDDWHQIIFLRYIGKNNPPFVTNSAHRIAITGFDDVDVIVLHDGSWDGDDWVDIPYAVHLEIDPSQWEEIFYDQEKETLPTSKINPINDSHFPDDYADSCDLREYLFFGGES